MPTPLSAPRALNILLATVGSHGDVYPFIALATALRDRGHHVTFATVDLYKSLVEKAGLPFLAIPPGEEDLQRTFGLSLEQIMQKAFNPLSGMRFLVKHVVMPYIEAATRSLLPCVRDADVVVTHSYAFSARIAADVCQVPLISVALQPSAFLSAHAPSRLPGLPGVDRVQPLLGAERYGSVLNLIRRLTRSWVAPVEAARTKFGLPSVGHPFFEGQFATKETVALYSKVLGEVAPDFPANTHICGFARMDGDPTQPLPQVLEQFLDSGPAPLVFTLGTTAVHNPGSFFQESVRAAQDLGQRAVFLAGAQAESLGRELPEQMLACGYVRHSLLFPRARAVVHHGGMGTVSQALRAACPQLVVPHGLDQPDNARRLVALGVARTTAPWRYRSKGVAAQLAQLTETIAYRQHAADIAAIVQAEEGVLAACRVIENAGGMTAT